MKVKRFHTFKIVDVDFKGYLDDLHRLVNRNISFGTNVNSEDQNIQGQMVEVLDSGLANTSVTIVHNLGYIPKFYDVKYIDRATQIFDFGTPWTTTKAFLASSTAHAKFRVFIH